MKPNNTITVENIITGQRVQAQPVYHPTRGATIVSYHIIGSDCGKEIPGSVFWDTYRQVISEVRP